MSRPWASVHPQHGADSRGGCGGAQAAFSASFPGRGRPLVHLMGGTEELGVSQLRERHGPENGLYCKSLSKPKSHNCKKQEAGHKKIPRKKWMKGASKSPESPLFKKLSSFHTSTDPELYHSRSLAPRVRSDAWIWPQELLDVELTD